jgi:hypothetical protein
MKSKTAPPLGKPGEAGQAGQAGAGAHLARRRELGWEKLRLCKEEICSRGSRYEVKI